MAGSESNYLFLPRRSHIDSKNILTGLAPVSACGRSSGANHVSSSASGRRLRLRCVKREKQSVRWRRGQIAAGRDAAIAVASPSPRFP
jgi:hypothetical protein